MIISIFFVEKKSTSHDNQFMILSLLKKKKKLSPLPLALVWGFIFLLDSRAPCGKDRILIFEWAKKQVEMGWTRDFERARSTKIWLKKRERMIELKWDMTLAL